MRIKTVKAILIGLGVAGIAASGYFLARDCPGEALNDKVCLTESEFTILRNSLAAKCTSGEPFSDMREYQLFIDVLNYQINLSGGELVVKNVEGDLLKSICQDLVI